MNAVTNFEFEDHLVRTVEINGEPWFVAKDVCAVLEHSNNRMAVEPLDDDEKAAVSLTYISSNGVSQERDTLVVSEGGLYTLMIRSRQAVTPGTPAHRFRKWVTAVLLPAIRKTGKWAPEEAEPLNLADLGFKLQVVRETRLSVGRKEAAPLMRALLAEMGHAPEVERHRPPQSGLDFVQAFLDECTEEDRHARVSGAALIAAYSAWADRNNAPAMTHTMFGRTLSALGVRRHRASTVSYDGIRLRHLSEITG